MKSLPLLLSLLSLSCNFLAAQSLAPDLGFGMNGLAVLDNGSNAPGRSTMVAVAPDGKILLGGFSLTGIGEPFMMARYHPDGTLDAAFGQNGVAQHAKLEGALKIAPLSDGKTLVLLYRGFQFARLNADGSEDITFQPAAVAGDENRNTYNTDLLVQPDGKILVTAFSPDAPFDGYCIARFLENGSVDTGFGFNGLAHINSNWAGYSQSIALEKDGKILVTGTNGYDKVSVVRYLVNGLPDPAFGTDGLAIWGQAIADRVFGRGLLVQPDGKILIAANASDDPQYYAVLYRMNADGTPDSTFANKGMVTSQSLSKIYGFCLQADGKMVLGGLKEGFYDRAALARFLPDGAPDNAYSGTASLANWEASNDGEPVGFALQPDGKMLAAIPTITAVSPTAGFLIVRLLDGGAKDPSFSQDGVAYASYDSGDDAATDVALQPDGKIVVIGDSYSEYLHVKTMLARYRTDGKIDPTFGVNGKKLFSLNAPNNNYAYGVTVQPDGKILAAIGYNFSSIELKVVRFNGDGSVDAGFGANGVAPVPGSFFRVADIVLQPDGKILVAGTLQDRKFAVVRLLPDGSPDAAFGNAGTASVPPGNIGEYGTCAGLALLPDGKIIVGGMAGFADAAVARFKANGQLDPTFSGDGKARFPMGTSFYVYAMNVQPDGKILLGGTATGFALMRILADGSALDAGFGNNGVAAFNIGTWSFGCSSVTPLPNGNILGIGGATSTGLAMVRLKPDGTPDTSGIAMADFIYGFADFTDAVLQPDGKIVTAGAVRQATDIDFGILRCLTGVLVGATETARPELALLALPNPFSNTLRLDFSSLPEPVREAAIFDLNGRQVFLTHDFPGPKMEIQGAQAWLSGMYTLWVRTEGSFFVQKLVKQ